MTSDGGWSFATAREPAWFGAAEHPQAPGVEHAITASGTLCGIASGQVVVYRHPFFPDRALACPRCREEAAAAPTEPCVQERLHDKVQAAAPGALRDELISALRKGADVTLWINGPADWLAKHYVGFDQIVEGSEPMAAALRISGSAGLAQVAHESWYFIVVLPGGEGCPVIARAISA